MSVYKEALIGIRKIREASRQIYPDACDYGAPVKVGDSLWHTAKQLAEFYGIEDSRRDNVIQVSIMIEILDEWNYEAGGAVTRILYKLTFVKTPRDKGMDGYLEIEKQ